MEKKKGKGIKATSKGSTAKHNVVEDMAKNGRFYRRKNWGYYWLDLSGIKDKKHPKGKTPYELTTRTRFSSISVFLARNYDLKHGSKKNFSIIKKLIIEAEINGDDYYDFNEPDKPCPDCSGFAHKCDCSINAFLANGDDDIVEEYEVCNICGRKLEDCLCSEEKIERECNFDINEYMEYRYDFCGLCCNELMYCVCDISKKKKAMKGLRKKKLEGT